MPRAGTRTRRADIGDKRMENNSKSFEKYVSALLDGRYRIEKVLGTGGMAVVFRAHDLKEDRTVAIKMLRDEIAGDPEAVQRFVNESRAVSMLSHPNIVDIHDVSVETQRKYLVMEYIEGISLRSYMDKRGALPLNEIISYTEQILSALAHAHSKGVVHRDIKPQNIMLLKDGAVKVMDFGIAKLPDSDTATMSDKTVGTVYYISPEQAKSNSSDSRSDLYSLGVMMYEMSTGRLPSDDESPISVVLMHMHDKPLPPRRINSKIPRGLEQLILCAMEKNPQKRYQSAADMLRELRRIKKNPSASVLTPARIAALKRSNRNRAENKPSRSITPIILGVAVAVLIVGLVSLFYVFDKVMGGMTKTAGVKIPAMVGLDRNMCGELLTEELQRQGLEEGDVVLVFEEEYSTQVAAGGIIQQSPTGGAHKKVPCTLTLTVSLGPKMLTMPDYTIMDWRTAKNQLREQGFMLTVVEQANDAIPSGYVIATDPAPGEQLVAGSAVTVYVSRGKSSGYNPTVKIPDFVGKTEPEARKLLEDASLSIGNVIYTRSPLPVGTVLGQSPAAGSDGAPGISAVSFTVSGGKNFDIRYIPDLTGMSRADALALLATYSLRAAKVEIVKSELEAGSVISQSPAGMSAIGGTPLPDPDNDAITITVSGGADYTAELRRVIMQRLVGRQLSQATQMLNLLGVNVGSVRYIRSSSPAGTVCEQSVAPDEILEGYAGELYVDLVVSGGPDWVNPEMTLNLPDVTGMLLEDAQKLLHSERIMTYVLTVRSADIPAGEVISQSPDADTEIEGREWEIYVTLIVSGGADYTEPEITDSPETTSTPETTDSPVTTEAPTPDITDAPETTFAPETTGELPELT